MPQARLLRVTREDEALPPQAFLSVPTRGKGLMYDLAAIAIGLGCFAFIFVLLYVLERV